MTDENLCKIINLPFCKDVSWLCLSYLIEEAEGGTLFNGTKHGLWIDYHSKEIYPEGKKKYEATYLAGKLEGKRRYWYSCTFLIQEETFAQGKLNGEYKLWHINGGIKCVGSYSKNKRCGNWTWFSPNGEIEYIDRYEGGNIVVRKVGKIEI